MQAIRMLRDQNVTSHNIAELECIPERCMKLLVRLDALTGFKNETKVGGGVVWCKYVA